MKLPYVRLQISPDQPERCSVIPQDPIEAMQPCQDDTIGPGALPVVVGWSSKSSAEHVSMWRLRMIGWRREDGGHSCLGFLGLFNTWVSMWSIRFFPECVARVPVSLWGCGGWAVFARRCATVRSRPQPLATVRNRPQPSAWGPYGRAYGKFCKRGPFWSFPASLSFISRGRRGTSWHFPTCFTTCQTWFLCGRRNTIATFSEDALPLSWQAQHFGDLRRVPHFWQA